MSTTRPSDEQLRTAIDVLEWVRSTAEEDAEISAEDRTILSGAAVWSASFLRGALGLPPEPAAEPGRASSPRARRRSHRDHD